MPANKLDILLKQDNKIFHTSDLGVLWDITNKDTLYMTIHRYTKKEILYPIHKGLYSVIPLDRLDPIKLGAGMIHKYSYLSTESVLSNSGLIAQAVYKFTFVSEDSKNFEMVKHNYLVRKLKTRYLYNTTGIFDRGDGILLATTERAIADLLYFQPSYHFDGSKIIDWKKVRRVQKEVGYL